MPFVIQSTYTKKYFVWGQIDPAKSWVDSVEDADIRPRRKDLDLIAGHFRGMGISCFVVKVKE